MNKFEDIAMNDDELVIYGGLQIGAGIGAIALSSYMVKKYYWGKTTGNIVNIIGIGEAMFGSYNMTNGIIRKRRAKEREQYKCYTY